MYCKNCGKEVAAGERFCGQCGARMDSVCPKCGKELKEGSAFCVHCGARVGGDPTKITEEASKRPEAAQDITAAVLETGRKSAGGFDTVGQTADSHAAGSDFADRTTVIRQIIGKNTDYYLEQFDRIHREGRSRINWASFFFGLLHASYRGVWRDWLKKVRIPLIAELACILLMGILVFIQPAAAVIFAVAGMAANIWLLVAQILFARKFNQVYMLHVERKLEQKELSADPSVKRTVIAGVVMAVVGSLLQILTQAAVMGGMLGSLLFMGGQSDIDSLDIDWDSYMEDIDLNDYSITGDAENNLAEEGKILEDGLTGNGETIPDTAYEDYGAEGTGYAWWEDGYQRCYGPAAYVWLVSVDENGILFTAGIGVSGYAAYVDMREFHAAWIDDHTALYEDSVSDYVLQIILSEDGGIVIYDSEPPVGSLQLAGIYTRESEADFPNCEYVFPQSSFAALSIGECEGMNELECKIARNEIYARHGRRFSDECLQAYFDSCSWYEGLVDPEDFLEGTLNETEKENIQTINEYESMMGFR